MQQLRFIDKPITQRVSGTIVPIFRSARLYTTAYGFQRLKCWQEPWNAGRQVVFTPEVGHNGAQLQECKAVHYCIWFSALKVLAGALERREAGRVHS